VLPVDDATTVMTRVALPVKYPSGSDCPRGAAGWLAGPDVGLGTGLRVGVGVAFGRGGAGVLAGVVTGGCFWAVGEVGATGRLGAADGTTGSASSVGVGADVVGDGVAATSRSSRDSVEASATTVMAQAPMATTTAVVDSARQTRM
jgi:hypothetical protein